VYHVNPASESTLELGTRTHPYKNINLPIVEIFNFLSNFDGEIVIKLSKSSDHFIRHAFVALNNITSVVFEPYNSNQKVASDTEYGNLIDSTLDSSTRVRLVIKDEGMFDLISV
jgi:hypothetical protein